MPAAYWVGDFSSDARDARNWYPYNVLPTPGDDLFFYGGGAAGNFDEDIDGDGNTDSRVPGGDCLGLAGDWATVEVVLGYAGTITLGANPSSWSVGTPAPTPPTPTPFTGSGVTVQQLMLDAPGANIAQHHPLTGEVSPLTITGDIPWWATPLPASLTWYGGALNDTSVASTVTVTGTTALIDPNGGAGTGTVTSGSTLSFAAGADGTVRAGTVSFVSDVSYILTGAGTALLSDTSLGNVVFQQPTGGQAVSDIGPGAVRTISGGGTDAAGAPVVVAGTLRIVGSSTFNANGGGTGVRSIRTDPTGLGAKTVEIENGSVLQVANEFELNANGQLLTKVNPGLQNQTDQRLVTAKIAGGFRWLGGIVTINAGSLNPHVWGTLEVTGNAVWSGGSLHMLVDSNSASNNFDQWLIGGSLAVSVQVNGGLPVANAPTVAVGTAGNIVPTPNQVWRGFIQAVTSITNTGPLPSAGTMFSVVQQAGNPVKKWDLQS